MEQHPHSILLIKDDFSQYSNRFLVYDDPRWHCRLFPNLHTLTDSEDANITNIKRHISMYLKSQTTESCFVFEELHTKFSVSAQREKTYLHRFYRCKISGNAETQKDDFTIDGQHYYWMSIAEMEQDAAIMQYNSDIVAFVKQNANF